MSSEARYSLAPTLRGKTPEEKNSENLGNNADFFAIPEELKAVTKMDNMVEETMLEQIAKEKFYFGPASLKDMEEVLINGGDFAVRCRETDSRQMELATRASGGVRAIPFKFIPLEGNLRSVTLNGQNCSPNSFKELITMHLTHHIAVDSDGTQISKPVNRPTWQLKKKNIKPEIKIGEGAFGTVWKGELIDENGGRTKEVAIKLAKICEENKQKMEEMLLEARLMRHLTHPNIVRFYGIVLEAAEVTIVMELVDGGGLNDYIRKNGKSLDSMERMSYCYDIALGIAYCHNQRICHRDVAARNCLVSLPKKRVKLSDFGMSKQGDEYCIPPTERTPIRWQAPEVIKTAIYTKACDVYSMGMTFYEIFSGERPFEGVSNKEIRARIQDPSFRPKMPDDVPKPLEDIIRRTWSDQPQSRLPAVDIATRLHEYRKHNKVTKKKPPVSMKASQVRKKKKSSNVKK